jgi:hypothetical protein
MIEFCEAIRRIIEPIRRDFVFDSHYVINQLIKYYSDEYIIFVSQYSNSQLPTFTAHQQIGQVINSCNALVRRLDYQSWSETIHCNGGECALWQRT